MLVNKDELKRALEIVKPGLANKEIAEQFTSFAFMQGCIVTYNDEISVLHPIKGIELTGAVKAEELYKFVSKLKSDEIDIIEEDNSIILKSGRATAGFAIEADVKLPIEEELSKKGEWVPLPKKFIEFLKFASMSCSDNLSLPILTCVHVNETGVIESSDNYRICHCKLNKPLPISTFLLPKTSVLIVTKLNVVEIAEGTGWVHFKTEEGTIVSCRTFNDTFIDTTPYLKPVKGGLNIVLPDNLNEILDRAIIFAKRDTETQEFVDIELNKRRLTVRSKSETSWFEERSTLQETVEPVQLSIMPYLLKDIFTQTKECTVTEKLLYFKGVDWVYISALRKIEK